MKTVLLYLLLLLFTMSCAKYQVVQEVQVNMYHMHNPKKGVQIIITKDSLELGRWYHLHSIKTIDIDN
jgi:hypothetical protein